MFCGKCFLDSVDEYPYFPELNPVEHLWDELREKAFGNCSLLQLGCS